MDQPGAHRHRRRRDQHLVGFGGSGLSVL